MSGWLKRLFSRNEAPQLPAGEAPAWAASLVELSQKISRAQARLALQVEELERKVEGGFAEARTLLAAAPREARPRDWDDLFDAVDLLDEAVRISAADPGSAIAQGLSGLSGRLERFLAAQGLRRVGDPGSTADGRWFRVVGTRPAADQPDGTIAQVVRAAVLEGDELIREGEVITVRNPS